MTDNSTECVTLEDVASDRVNFAKAHMLMKARTPKEWLIGGTIFTVGFSLTTYFLRPNAPLAIYLIIAATSFAVSGMVVFMNTRQTAEWYKAKAAELDGVEYRIRCGEKVPRPKPPLNNGRAKTSTPGS